MDHNPLLDAALDYAVRLGPVFPLFTPRQDDQGNWVCDCPDTYKADDRCSPGKHPRTKHGSTDGSRDPDQIRRWWSMFPHANIGLSLAGGNLLDVGPDDVAWHAEFRARGLPATFTFASSGAGHMHYLYARPAWCPLWRICKQHEYDILTNGYVVMPPSLHISGNTYLLADDRDPTEPPRWSVEALVEASQRPKASDIVVEGDAATEEEIERIVERIDPAVWLGTRFDDRSSSLHAIAGDSVKAGARNVATVYAIVSTSDVRLGYYKYANRTPEQAHRAYLALAEGAFAKNTPDVHVPISQSRSSSVPTGGWEPGNHDATLAWMTPHDMRYLHAEDVTWLVEGLVGQGLLTEIDGYAKLAGKTTFALAMVAALLESEPFLDRPTQYSPVVYLTEQSAPSFRRTLERSGLLYREQQDMHILTWHSAQGWKWPEIVASAVAKCAEVEAKLLIVDTFAQWVGMRGDEENSAGAMARMMAPVQQAAAGHDLAVLVLRHDRKSGGEVGKSSRGSSFGAGAVDIIAQLRRMDLRATGGSRNQRVLETESRFEETPQELVIELRDGPPVHYTVASQGVEQLRNEARIMQILAVLPLNEADALTTTQIIEATSIRKADLLGTLNLMVERGYISRRGTKNGGFSYWQEPVSDA